MLLTQLAIDMCATYGPTGLLPTLTVQSCQTTAPNQRTITCTQGYWAQGVGQAESDFDIVLVGNAVFAGCGGKF